ncbi:acyltransferase [Candidatus Saccharibacteria bacterium]|nr:acyltransferase [Candidatus Saccharibacteria bacterium]MBR3122190.1 acyltransferase [Candidatus Saccharibacteria bacterium]
MTSKSVSDIFNWYNLSKYRNVIYGFSAIWIILFHIANRFPNSVKYFHPFIVRLFQAGNVGVDIFLIMSGICLYFSLKKTNGKHILNFYKKRFSKLLKIYLFVCLPWFIFCTLSDGEDFNFFFNQATIFGNKLGEFWFINFIAICYLVYPLIYQLIEKKKSYYIIIFIPIYIIFLCILNATCKDFYQYCEIGLTRVIPFLVGSLLATRVYEKKPIKQSTVLIILALLFIRDAFFIILQKKGFTAFEPALSRFYLTVLALSTIFLIIIFFELFKLPKTRHILESVGNISLESYVVHIIILKSLVDKNHFATKNITQLIIFTVAITVVSLLISKLVQKILNLIPPRPPKHPVSSPSSPPL